MSLVVQKFGGTSVADPDRIRRVARHVVDTANAGNEVVVVVSAMGKSTNELEKLAFDVSANPSPREMDMLLTAGERIAMSLLCMAIIDGGRAATSFTGSQAGIVTDTSHGRAKILEVKGDRIRDVLAGGAVCVVAGFQGVSTDRDVTTLGRGGSDTTAVALAAVLGASVCELYTDVDGVFTADPRVVPAARPMARISFDEMLEMAATGCPKPEMRAVEFARNYRVPLHVRSSFTGKPGTMIQEADPDMEQAIISAVTHDTSEAKVTVDGVPDRPGIAARLFRSLADAGVNVDMIVQNVSHDGTTDISFTIPKSDAAATRQVLDKHLAEVGGRGATHDDDIARVSLVGAGMKTHPGVAATMFETLADKGINIEMISTSSIRISCVVKGDRVNEAVQVLHTAFGLDVEE
ncbi:MAG TPA: aspartate kinase [Acidimicrobiales bacterium]